VRKVHVDYQKQLAEQDEAAQAARDELEGQLQARHRTSLEEAAQEASGRLAKELGAVEVDHQATLAKAASLHDCAVEGSRRCHTATKTALASAEHQVHALEAQLAEAHAEHAATQEDTAARLFEAEERHGHLKQEALVEAERRVEDELAGLRFKLFCYQEEERESDEAGKELARLRRTVIGQPRGVFPRLFGDGYAKLAAAAGAGVEKKVGAPPVEIDSTRH